MPVTIKRKSEKLEAVNIRLTTKMKFALTLAAKLKEQSQASYVVECLLDNLKGCKSGLMIEPSDGGDERYLPDLVWHELEYRRITNMGIHAPSLLDGRELLIWTVIEENPRYWKDKKPVFARIRENWEHIKSESETLGKSDM